MNSTHHIAFTRHSAWFNLASVLVFAMALFSLVTKGLNLGIEFTGGTLVEIRYTTATAADTQWLRTAIQEKLGIQEPLVQNFGSSRDLLLRFSPEQLQKAALLNHQGELDVSKLEQQVLNEEGRVAEIRRVEFIGPQIGETLFQDGLIALALVVLGISLYLAARFEWRFSIAAFIANLHDVLLIIGCFSWFQWELSLPVLAAILAVLGYSVNESVVVFDRVRETFRELPPTVQPKTIFDVAITRTMSRTIITHGSTLIMTCTMLIFGGPTLYYFALTLSLGIIFGVYSSIWVASSVAVALGTHRQQFIQKPKRQSNQNDPNDGAVV